MAKSILDTNTFHLYFLEEQRQREEKERLEREEKERLEAEERARLLALEEARFSKEKEIAFSYIEHQNKQLAEWKKECLSRKKVCLVPCERNV